MTKRPAWNKKLATSEVFDGMANDGVINGSGTALDESETSIQKRILDALNGLGIYGRWFRNSQVRSGNYKGGLGVGSADLIGIKTIVITQEMVGTKVGVFAAIEVKRVSGGVVSKTQIEWLKDIKKRGGIAAVVSSTWAAFEVLKGKGE